MSPRDAQMDSSSQIDPNPASSGWLLPLPIRRHIGRPAIESCFEQMNSLSPAALRRPRPMPLRANDALEVSALAMPERARSGGSTFMVETHLPVALDVETLDASVAPDAYSVCLPLTGEFRLCLNSGEVQARAGQALIIDPAEVQLTQVSAGTHFLEFNLPKAQFLRLGAELSADGRHGSLSFAPLLQGDLVQRLLFMALQASQYLLPNAEPEPHKLVMFERWTEMLALTLLAEHGTTLQSAATRSRPGGTPPALKRAIDYMAAHVHEDMVLSDIAAAACLSGSTLWRLFREQLGRTPGVYLRELRLDGAHAELRRGSERPVQEVASRWGFQNASKFASAYRQRFGESPSETRSAKRRFS